MSDTPLILVSNRGPATFGRDEGGELRATRGGGGLVTALQGLVEHRDAIWVASAMSDEDVEVSRAHGGHHFTIEVNAFQSQAEVVIQKSTREGFGLTVSEALWKARPFIGGDVGGIPLQVQDGTTGYLVSNADDCADRALRILEDPELGKQLGRAGKEHVRKHFLTPRLLRDWLQIFRDLG